MKTCPKCRATIEEGQRHGHCSSCGVALGPKAVHAMTCAIKGLPPGTWCPLCRRLLAAGAPCPEHGHPRQVQAVSEKEGAPK